MYIRQTSRGTENVSKCLTTSLEEGKKQNNVQLI